MLVDCLARSAMDRRTCCAASSWPGISSTVPQMDLCPAPGVSCVPLQPASGRNSGWRLWEMAASSDDIRGSKRQGVGDGIGTPTISGDPLNTSETALNLAFDFTSDELSRRMAVLKAIGPDWDPGVALANEEAAYRMLYSDLDNRQQQIYDNLVSAGVLPGIGR